MRDDLDFAAEPRNAFASFEEATHYLEQLCARLEVNHLAYSLVHSIDGIPDQVSWIATYDPAYMSYYMKHYSHLGDPSVEIAFANNRVVDWAELLILRFHVAGIISRGDPIRDNQIRNFLPSEGR